MFSILTDGVYVLVQGCVKMIVFDEEHPTYKSNMKEITSNTFRKLRINKELGIRTRDTGSEHIKKFLVSEKSE
jgi:ssDNA-binding replication factor A large subunit